MFYRFYKMIGCKLFNSFQLPVAQRQFHNSLVRCCQTSLKTSYDAVVIGGGNMQNVRSVCMWCVQICFLLFLLLKKKGFVSFFAIDDVSQF